MRKGSIVVVAGTRPEAIKMMPVYAALKQAGYPTLFCSTMQHDQLLYDVLDLFDITPDIDLGVMRINQDLFYITQSLLQKSKEFYKRVHPSLVLVQGDTTSTMACALSAFYLKIPVGHIEAGLRTYDMYAPFPEEVNRRIVSSLATYHFAPTVSCTDRLLAEGINAQAIYCTGNTVLDALRITKELIASGTIQVTPQLKTRIDACKQARVMLFTMHRRESFSGALTSMLACLSQFLKEHPDIYCFYPYHPNPHVIDAVKKSGLCALANCFLSEPITYQDMVYLLDRADIVLTDSGGIQEEAVSLGKPVLVLREKSERSEGIAQGIAHLVGFQADIVQKHLHAFAQGAYSVQPSTVYGDGYASERIVSIIKEHVEHSKDDITFAAAAMDNKGIDNEGSMKKVTVLGLGYIGLPTSIVLADAGFNVVGFDIDGQRVDAVNQGEPVIQEPDLFEKLQIALQTHRFSATRALSASDYFIIAVPTPFKENKRADVSYVFDAATYIAQVLKKGDVIILESTVPVGTTHALSVYLQEKTGLVAGKDFYVAHCPERVLPGKIFKELIENDRIIGGIDQASAYKARDLYQTFAQGALYITDAHTAEMVKLIENSSRDVQIAFAHQVASMASAVGLNPYEVIELANKHPRVNILKPSAGVGGHCIAVDPWFLIETFGQQTQLLQAARHINDNRPLEVLEQIGKAINVWTDAKKEQTCTLLLMGLTYKPDVDDIRESAAIRIAHMMCQRQGVNLLVCEPHLNQKKLQALYNTQVVTIAQGLAQADIVVFLVAHSRFKAIDKKLLQDKTVLDVCGVLEQARTEPHLYWPAHAPSLYARSAHRSSRTMQESL